MSTHCVAGTLVRAVTGICPFNDHNDPAGQVLFSGLVYRRGMQEVKCPQMLTDTHQSTVPTELKPRRPVHRACAPKLQAIIHTVIGRMCWQRAFLTLERFLRGSSESHFPLPFRSENACLLGCVFKPARPFEISSLMQWAKRWDPFWTGHSQISNSCWQTSSEICLSPSSQPGQLCPQPANWNEGPCSQRPPSPGQCLMGRVFPLASYWLPPALQSPAGPAWWQKRWWRVLGNFPPPPCGPEALLYCIHLITALHFLLLHMFSHT